MEKMSYSLKVEKEKFYEIWTKWTEYIKPNQLKNKRKKKGEIFYVVYYSLICIHIVIHSAYCCFVM